MWQNYAFSLRNKATKTAVKVEICVRACVCVCVCVFVGGGGYLVEWTKFENGDLGNIGDSS